MQFAPQIERWRPLVTKYWGDLADVGLAIISFEAPSGDPNAHNTSGEDSRGLFQINVAPGAHPQWANVNLFDPETNIKYATLVWNGQGPTAWSVWSRVRALLPSGWTYRKIVTDPSGSPSVPSMPEPGKPEGPGPAPSTPLPPITAPDPFSGFADSLGGVAAAIGALPATIAAPFVAAINQAYGTLAWLGQTHIWERIGLVVFGAVLVLVGLVLFGLSFVPKGTPVPV